MLTQPDYNIIVYSVSEKSPWWNTFTQSMYRRELEKGQEADWGGIVLNVLHHIYT